MLFQCFVQIQRSDMVEGETQKPRDESRRKNQGRSEEKAEGRNAELKEEKRRKRNLRPTRKLPVISRSIRENHPNKLIREHNITLCPLASDASGDPMGASES